MITRVPDPQKADGLPATPGYRQPNAVKPLSATYVPSAEKSDGAGVVPQCGSLKFTDSGTYLTFPGSSDWTFGSGAFTIEWHQYMVEPSDSNQFARVFSVGNYPNTSIGVSIEAGTLYLWIGGTPARRTAVLSNYLNRWVHFAVSRGSASGLVVYQDGRVIAGSRISNSAADSTSVLAIGAQTDLVTTTIFPGLITNFHFNNSQQKYSSAFTPPTSLIPKMSGSKLLLLATTSASAVVDSASGKTATNHGVTWNTATPIL